MRRITGVGIAVLTIVGTGRDGAAATLLPGFAETQVASGIVNPTAMSIAPDGRVFVSRQAGQLLVIKNDALLPTPALTLTVDSTNERGLLGTAFDPDFPASPYIYIYYTRPNPGARNVVSRFTVSGDTISPASEVVIYQLPLLGPAPIHNSGSMHFGPDGKLYISVGENSYGPHSQNLDTTFGKLLRINKDGSIPEDNPFYRGPDNPNGAIWAYGLRNPFTFAINPAGRIFVNDVGDKFWDEINDIKKGGNYGWPDTEGPHDNPAFEQSFVYLPWNTSNCTVIGAAFYNPAVRNFPLGYVGKYFVGDLCGGFIKAMDPATGQAELFVSNITPGNTIVDIDVAPNGMLYYLRRGSTIPGQVFKVFVNDGRPNVSVPPQSQLISEGETVTFNCEASGFEPMTWAWTRTKDGAVSDEGSGEGRHASLSFPVSMDDHGAVYTCAFTNERGTDDASATLSVTTDTTPNAWIISPAEGTLYQAGTMLHFSGDAFDAEDGPLPAGAFTWEIVFDHDTHNHPGMPPTSGIKSGSYTIPTTGEQAPNVGYRIILTVVDSAGLRRRVERVVTPETTTLSVFSSPTARTIKLDGVPKTAPFSLPGVVGMQRLLGIATTQASGLLQQEAEGSPIWWEFTGWSDGGAAAHNINLQAGGNEFTASFNKIVNPNCITPVALARFVNMPMASRQTGVYEIEFDATPLAASINATLGVADGVHGGLPYQTDTVGFGTNGRFGTASGLPVIPYQANKTYRVRMRVDFINRKQSAYVTPPGGAEGVIRNPTDFRAERQVDTSNDTWGLFVSTNPGTTARICNVELNCRSEKNTAPVINDLTASTTNIWPPNHKMITIHLDYTVSDNCLSTTAAPQVMVTSNEPDNGVAEEDEPGDIEIVDNKTVRVRAERADEGSGRVYTITVVAVDAAGLAGSSSVTVTVPHNQ